MSDKTYPGLGEPDQYGGRVVEVAGHSVPLVCSAWAACGGIDDGVGFQFGNQGGWVIALDTLRSILAFAEDARKESA